MNDTVAFKRTRSHPFYSALWRLIGESVTATFLPDIPYTEHRRRGKANVDQAINNPERQCPSSQEAKRLSPKRTMPANATLANPAKTA